MRSNTIVGALFLLSLLAVVMVGRNVFVVKAQSGATSLCVSPSIYVAQGVNETFTVSINISQVSNLHIAQLTLSYNKTLIAAVGVSQGTFFPPSPNSNFKFKINQPLGVVQANISLVKSGTSLSGNGSLAYFSLRALASSSLASCFLMLDNSVLLDPNNSPIQYSPLDTVYFWKSIQLDPSVGPYLDIFTQQAGRGPNVMGGIFKQGDLVALTASLTYSQYPVINKPVAFVVLNPNNQTILYSAAFTDSTGLASVIFRIPIIPGSLGYWTCLAVAEVDNKIVWDITRFLVQPSPLPAGGYSVSKGINVKTEDYVSYWMATIFLTGFVVVVSRKRRNQMAGLV